MLYSLYITQIKIKCFKFFSYIFIEKDEPRIAIVPVSNAEGVPCTQSSSSHTVVPGENIPLSKEYVKKCVKDGTFSTCNVVKRSGKKGSPVWEHIQTVLDVNNNVVRGFYYCLSCSNVIVNHSASTTPFIRHGETCTVQKNQIPITQYTKTSVSQSTVKVSMQHRQKLKDGMSEFVCHDLRPFAAVEGKGFVAAMCASFELGQANPNLNRSDFRDKILPGRTTIQKGIEAKADLAKQKVKAKLQTAYQEFGGFGCTSDMWSDDFRQKNYITVTAHVAVLNTDQITYERYVIGVEEVKEKVKSKDVIERHILTILSWYGFSESDAKSSVYFVTDRGSNFKAMTKFDRANCYAHMLHNIVKAMCEDTELSVIIKNARDLVRYIKKAGLNYRYDLRLKSYCQTRWSTVYTMLNSILTKFDDVYGVLEKRQRENKKYSDCLQYIECLHKSTLSSIVSLLEPFKIFTDFVEADKCITIHRVWPIYSKIKLHLMVSSEANDTRRLNSKNLQLIEGIKALGRDYIRSISDDFQPTMEQNIAVALHMRMKKLKKLPTATREATFKKIDELINLHPSKIDEKKNKQRKSKTLFDSFADSDEDETTNGAQGIYCQELEQYLNAPIPNDDDCNDSTSLRQWWFKQRLQFPNLFKLFMKISAIPASSAPSERCFSVTGQIISEKRSCILPENVSNIMMCRNLY